jgi:hypothetical protein
MDKKRVIVYIDGFNLYFGLKESNFQRFYWLNLQNLILSFLGEHQDLIKIKYFTSIITTSDYKKKLRQEEYLRAIGTLKDFDIIYGKYVVNPEDCKIYNPLVDKCGGVYNRNNEKMTDVNIALSLVIDAIDDKFDSAILISGDMDLFPAVKYIRDVFPKKTLSIFFPPKRQNNDLARIASGSLVLARAYLKKSQFPNELIDKYGEKIKRPAEWV